MAGGIDSYTKLMLHANGTDASTTFTDDSANGYTVTPSGNAQIDTAQSKFGGASALFDGSGDYLSIADNANWQLDAGNGSPFSIDFWIRPHASPIYQDIIGQPYDGPSNKWTLYVLGSTIYFYIVTGGSATLQFHCAFTYSADTWYHIELTRVDNTNAATGWRIFINGVGQTLTKDSGNWNGSIPNVASSLVIAKTISFGDFNGWIDELRLSKGIARHTSDFTPESSEYSLPLETADITDTLTLTDDFQLQTNPDNQTIDDTLTLSDAWDLISTYEPLTLSDILTLTDSWDARITPDNQSIADTLTLADDWTTLDTPKLQSIADSLTLSDSYSFHQIIRKLMRLDLRWHELFLHGINLSLSWLLAKTINTDLRWLRTVKSSFNTDLRWLTNPYTIFTPINSGDFQIFINGTDVLLGNDIDVQSGNIVHTVGQKSQATFVLARKHDDLNRTHSGASSQITNNNPVQIYIDGHLEFDGTITELAVNSETETITVLAQMEQPSDNRHSISLPLPSVNEKLHPYHCLINNAQIDNPLEDTRAVIIGSNGWYWTGSTWTFFIENAMTFGSDAAAQSYVDSYNDVTVNKVFDIKKPSVTSREKNPPYYKGVKINLGTKIIQQVDKFRDLEYIIDGKGHYASQIEDGTFVPKPNYSYFWAVLAHNVRTGQRNGDYRYIGTSLGSVATDLWVLDGVSPYYQKVLPNIVTELGYYYIGEAPYKEVSAKNGQLIPAQKWQDKNDGLYNVLEASYNFIDYAKTVANLEYQKLLNINGTVLPITGSSIDITFDAYYFYNVKLLTRINVTNTTVANTFNNTNGFPVSVKSISINFKSMKITLNTDNRLSQIELDEIESTKPDEDSTAYVYPASAVRVYHKFDLKTWSYVS